MSQGTSSTPTSRPVLRKVIALGLLLAGLFAAALATAPAASAHATVVASDPVDGSRLQQAPAAVTITFDEAISLNSGGFLHVVDQAGRRVDAGPAGHPNGAGSQVSVKLKAGLGDGTYTGSFRIASADGHPVAGAIRFVVGNGELVGGASSSSTVDSQTSFAFDVVRWITFAGLALLGGSWLMFSIWPEGRDDRTARRLVWTGWLATVAAAVAELLLQGPYSAGAGLGDVANWSLLDATLHTTFGTAHSVRLLLLGALGVLLSAQLRNGQRTRLAEVGGALGIGIVLTYAASGHAESENPRWLAMTSYSAHLAAMSVWVGGLAYLLAAVLPRRDPVEIGRVLPVFSRTAMYCVTVLAVSGTYQAWLGIGSIDAITSTRYGQFVLIKVALFVGLLGLGNLSRVVVQRRYVRPVAYAMTAGPPASTDEPADLGPIRRSVFAELLVALVVLAVTAVLVAEPPGRAALATTRAQPQTATTSIGGGREATVTIEPGKHGPVSITIVLSAGPKPLQVTATAALPDRQLGPIPFKLATHDGATFTASGVVLPAAGRWIITLTVRTSEFASAVATAKIRLY